MKLALPEDAVEAVRRALAERARRKPSAAELITTYYDTQDLSMQRCGASLRVRDEEGRFTQTVKTQNGAGTLARGEWEESIAGAAPDLAAKKTVGHLPKKIRRSDIYPLFTTRVSRTVFDIRPRPSVQIEAAIDTGRIEAALGDGAAEIREIELEMKEGEAADIYDLALALLEVAPLRIGLRSKSARGYGLVDSALQTPASCRQRPILLAQDRSAEEALQTIGRECLGHLLGNLPAALADDPEGIHQMRVAARRLRSLLSAAKKMLPEGQRRWASGELRCLADALGDARNWDSFIAGLVPAAREGLFEPAEREILLRAAEERRAEAHVAAQQAIRGSRYAQSILRLLRWFETRSWRDEATTSQMAQLLLPASKVAPFLLERCRRQVRRRSRHFSELGAAQRHKLRIALKQLRYNIGFFASLYPTREIERLTACLKPLQDALGHANDVRVARTLVRGLRDPHRDGAVARASGYLLGWHGKAVAEAERGIADSVRRMRDAPAIWR